MPDTFDPDRFAAMLVTAHKTLTPLTAEQVGTGPSSLAEVGVIHSEVMHEIGPAGAFKTAYPDGDNRQIMAPIPDRHVRQSPARYDASEMRLYGIEIEIAFRIDRDLPSPEDPEFENRLRDAVSVVPAIEMVDSRIADHEGQSALTKLADNQMNFGLVVGAPVKEWWALNLTTPAVSFTVDGRQIGPTEGMVPGGHSAFDVLAGLVSVAGDYCGGLKVGQYVTCGAVTGLHWTKAGTEIKGTIEGIGDVAVTIAK
jgi:2-keto-4-pentenoate hydratase